MIGTSLSAYVFIRISIFLVQYTTPLCLFSLALLALAHGGSPTAALAHPVGRVLALYSVLDALYAAFVYLPFVRRLKTEARHPPALSRATRRALFEKCLVHMQDPERYLRLWFLGADEAAVRRDNVHDFILWAYFDLAPGHASADEAAEADEYVDMIEDRMGRKLVPGRGSAEGLRLTFHPVETRYRSLVWCLIVGVVDVATHAMLAWNGFEYHAQPLDKLRSVVPLRIQSWFAQRRSEAPDMGYWYRPHTARDKRPVLFLHGIGIGLLTYAPFLAQINRAADKDDGQIGIIAMELLPVSFRLTEAPLRKLEFLRQMETVLEARGWDRFVLATHSYGSVLATHMVQSPSLGPRVASLVFFDPVSILLHLPDVAYNFTRRRPRAANEWQLWYFASMDPGVALALGRHFFWKENIVWREELLGLAEYDAATGVPGEGGGVPGGQKRRRKVAVCLSGRDLIVDTLSVAKYMADDADWLPSEQSGLQGQPKSDGAGAQNGQDVEVHWFHGLDHAQVFEGKANQDYVSGLVRRFCAA